MLVLEAQPLLSEDSKADTTINPGRYSAYSILNTLAHTTTSAFR